MVPRNNLVSMQERGLSILARHGAFRFTDTFFPYTSGEIGPYFVQSGEVMKDGADYICAILDMAKQITDSREGNLGDVVISGGETRDWIFSNPVAFQLAKPSVMLYKNGKMVGADVSGREVIHVADLNNEGSSPRDFWVPTLKNAGANISDIFFYVDRMEEGVNVMDNLGLNRHAVVPLDEHAWDYLKGKGYVNDGEYDQLMNRGKTKEERGAWARNMLGSDKGFETLRGLYATDATRAKAQKILDVGYPDLKDELTSRLARGN